MMDDLLQKSLRLVAAQLASERIQGWANPMVCTIIDGSAEITALRPALATRDARIAELEAELDRAADLQMQWANDANAAESRATAAEERLKEAERIMQPLAEAAYSYDPDEGDGSDLAWAHDFKIGTLRAARAFLDTQETTDEQAS